MSQASPMRLMTILAELRTADAQPRDWYAWATNKAAHMALVGIPAALLLLWLGVHFYAVPLIVAAIYGLGWEWAIQRGKDSADSLMDTAMVMAGAALVAALSSGEGAGAVFAIYAALTAFGVWRRL